MGGGGIQEEGGGHSAGEWAKEGGHSAGEWGEGGSKRREGVIVLSW